MKLYIEILDDPKVGMMEEYLFARMIKLFLVAKEINQDGLLPPVSALAWRLRMNAGSLSETLSALGSIGVVRETNPGIWLVVNFKKRQEAESSTERSQHFRKRKCNDTLPVVQRSATSSSTSTSASDSSSDSFGFVFKAYEQNFGAITPMIAESVADSVKEYSAEWVMAALEDSVKANVRKWSYAEAILRRWKVDGFRSPGPGKNGTGKKPKKEYDYEALREKAKKEGL